MNVRKVGKWKDMGFEEYGNSFKNCMKVTGPF